MQLGASSSPQARPLLWPAVPARLGQVSSVLSRQTLVLAVLCYLPNLHPLILTGRFPGSTARIQPCQPAAPDPHSPGRPGITLEKPRSTPLPS